MIPLPEKVPEEIKAKIRQLTGEKVIISRYDSGLEVIGYLTEYDEKRDSIKISKSKADPEHNFSIFYAGWIKSIDKFSGKYYVGIALWVLIAVLFGTCLTFGTLLYKQHLVEKKIATITPSFRGAKNIFTSRLNEESQDTYYWTGENFKIKKVQAGSYRFVSDSPIYFRNTDGKINMIIGHWGYNEKHGNWELIRTSGK